MAEYIQRHAGVGSQVIHPPIYGTAPWPVFGRFDHGSVLMINPCAVKGIGIFVELARRLPEPGVPRALTGWGTTTADKELLAKLANVRLLASVPNIDQVLSETRMLLMPSIWYEGFGLIAMEAMLRGIPVISSDSGGLKEAKEGTGFVLPVRPVERYLAEFDEVRMPVPVEAAQADRALGGRARDAVIRPNGVRRGIPAIPRARHRIRGHRCAPPTLSPCSNRWGACASCSRTIRCTTHRTAAAINRTGC